MSKKWRIKNYPKKDVAEFAKKLKVSERVAGLLWQRGIQTVRAAREFLNPQFTQLHNPFLLPDMERAVLRTRAAIQKKEKILVYGDRDVDGVTSIAVVMRTLKALGADVVWAVPKSEGYGLHAPILAESARQGAKLVVTVDCGTSAIDEIAYANTLGMDVIVTDHHLPPENLPQAYAIVNPNRRDSNYPMKDLAGCLTAFKFSEAVMMSYSPSFGKEYVVFDLETTGLSPDQHEIVEIGALLIRNFVPVGMFETLVRPRKPISPEAIAIHGITNEMVANAPHIENVLGGLLEFIGSRPIVAHNARFDMGFLKRAVAQHLHRDFANEAIDTLSRAREAMTAPGYSLAALAQFLGIEQPLAHRSMADCHTTAALFRYLEEIADPRLQFFREDQLDVVTLGTIADIVPLLGENRVVVKHGLPSLYKTRKVGLRKLLDAAFRRNAYFNKDALELAPTAKDISWSVTPILNAAGRFSQADISVRLLLTDSEVEASRLVEELLDLNQSRKELQKTNVEKFMELAESQCCLQTDRLIFVVGENMEHGVTGIVASMLARKFQKPAVLLILNGEEATGSARSIPGFHLVEAFDSCRQHLTRYGGHAMAAGLSSRKEHLELLRGALLQYATEHIREDFIHPEVDIDWDLCMEEVSGNTLEEISALEPFGESNPAPIFTLRGALLESVELVGSQKNHLKIRLSSCGRTVQALGWNMAELGATLFRGAPVDIVFHLESCPWEKTEGIKLVLLDCQTTPLDLRKDEFVAHQLEIAMPGEGEK